MGYLSFSEFLNQKYTDRKERNTKYSLRSFSRDLNISSGRLTNLLKGRDIPGPETIEKIASILKLGPEELEELKNVLAAHKYMRRGLGFSRQLNKEEFKEISDWKTWCIYTLFQSSDFIPTYSWLKQKIHLPEDEISQSLKKLKNLGLIDIDGDFYKLVCENVTTTNDVPSPEIRKFHKEFINKGIDALDVVPVEIRDISSLTLCINPGKLAEFKKMLADFRAKVNEIAKEDEDSSELYQLNIQFFPMGYTGEKQK